MTPRDRWRLVLGRYARPSLGACSNGSTQARCDALDQLYDLAYADRGGRPDDEAADEFGGQPEECTDDDADGAGAGEPGARPSDRPRRNRTGTLGASGPVLVSWLNEVRELFPRETVETIERHALDRFGLTGLVTDPEVLARLEPSEWLLRTLMTLRPHLDEPVMGEVRRIIAVVVEELRRRLRTDVHQKLTGRLDRNRHSPLAVTANFDPRGSIRANLRNWDPERRQIVVADPKFFQRNVRRLPWEIVLCVDQSGSMVGSVIHSAVMAGILAEIQSFRVRLVLFDTSIVDLTDQIDDPVELILRVQLGGGTDIGQALRYVRQVVDQPQRTVLVLVTDFHEGADQDELVRSVRRLAEDRVRMIGLAALDGDAEPAHDREMAQRLADEGMTIAALTPRRLAAWLAEVTAR